MKVLEVASSLRDWGGIERYVVYLTQGLAARGHEVEATCPPGSPLAQRLEVPHHRLALRGKHSLVALARYIRLLRSRDFDLIHVHFSPDFLMPAYAAKLTGRPKVVLSRHVALRWSSRKAQLYRRMFDHIIPVADAVQKKLLESGIPAEQMTVAKAGCPASVRTKPVQETRLALGIDGYSVGCFGRLVSEKGLDTVLNAKPEMTAQVHIFGEGPKRAELEKIANGAKFHGFVPDVVDAMGAVDVVAIPSIWAEAFPFAALEAMSLARPILASRIGGLPEMVEDSVNGLLFEAANVRDFLEKQRELESDPARGAEMGRRGQELHAAEFTVERMAERIEKVFAEVVGSR